MAQLDHQTHKSDARFDFMGQRYIDLGMSSICTLPQYLEDPDGYEACLASYRKLAGRSSTPQSH
jgi:hypothetical protein